MYSCKYKILASFVQMNFVALKYILESIIMAFCRICSVNRRISCRT